MKVEQLTKERDGYKEAFHSKNTKELRHMYGDDKDSLPVRHQMHVDQLTKEKEKLKASLATVQSEYDNLHGKYKSMQKKLKATGAAIKEEMSNAIVKEAREHFKKYLWPTKKLVDAQDADEVEGLTKSIYDGIKVAQKFEEEGGRYELDYDEFHRIYSKMIMDYVSTMRSTCQTECKKAIMGK